MGYPVLRIISYDVTIGGKATSMSKSRNDRNLSENEIVFIEQSLNEGQIPAEIARQLGRDPSGLRREIRTYASYFGSRKHCELCLDRPECKISFLCHPIKDYKKCSSCKKCDDAASRCAFFRIEMQCEILKKKHVCNGCKQKSECELTYRYIAFQAILKHEAAKNRSHVPLKFEDLPEEFLDYVSGRLCAGISPEIILNTLPERFEGIRICVPTLYSYIDKGLLNATNLDLRNKVSRNAYGKGEKRPKKLPALHQLNGRSIEDLNEEDLERPLGVAEMDTVEGIKGKAVLLTLMIPKYSLMLAFRMKSKTQSEVKMRLNILEFKLGDFFPVLFSKIIPDNGSEFLDYDALEKSINGNQKRCHIYYTHPYASYEKPHVENNHILLRWLIRKGYDITLISDEKILEIINILNNYPRPAKGYTTPIELMEEELGPDILKKLNLRKIPIEELNLHISLVD